ncbi:MAG TPA: hypothetical protein VK141_01510 [Nitrosomonas sp.]|nr:hypothetical protein [Nitrosomonas sp.]
MATQRNSAQQGDGSDSVDIDIDDDSVLADGMIPDSRIVQLIDELDVSHDESNDDND